MFERSSLDSKLQEKDAIEKTLLKQIQEFYSPSAGPEKPQHFGSEMMPSSRASNKIKICEEYFQDESGSSIKFDSLNDVKNDPPKEKAQITDPVPAYIKCLEVDPDLPSKDAKSPVKSIRFEDQCQSTRTDENLTVSAHLADTSINSYKKKSILGAYKQNTVKKRNKKGKCIL